MRAVLNSQHWLLARAEGKKFTNLGIPSSEGCDRLDEQGNAGPPLRLYDFTHLVYNIPGNGKRGVKMGNQHFVARKPKEIILASLRTSHP